VAVLRRVGLNLLYLVPGQVGGSEVFARRLTAALGALRPQVEFVAYCGADTADALRDEDWPDNVRVRPLPVRASVKPLRIAAEIAALPPRARRDGVELLHSLGTTSPPFAGMPSVATVLDLIYEHYPQTFPLPARLGLRALVGPGARRADRVIAISKAVRRDVIERLRVPPERIDVVYLGYGIRSPSTVPPEEEIRSRYGLGSFDVVLCVSAALVHKNLERLIDAFARLAASRPDLVLTIVGHAGREQQALLTRASIAGVADQVVLTDWIPEGDLEALYRAAACCVYPSLHEGFGLPVLEAMARDVPLACSNATSLPEVAGDAAEFFDPRDVDGMARAIASVLEDPARRAELVRRGRERVRRFTWERCAEDVLTTYERALSRAARS
jgi:glycosyltransferase involved in cell wall biosynthesis